MMGSIIFDSDPEVNGKTHPKKVEHDSEVCGLSGPDETPLCPGCAAAEGNSTAIRLNAPKRQRPVAADGVCTNTDTGNAQRLVKRHGTNLRYCHPFRRWFVWTGTHWTEDEKGDVPRLAKDEMRRLLKTYSEILAKCSEEDPRKEQFSAMLQWVLKSLDAKRLKPMIELAQSEPGIPIVPGDMDRDQWLLNVKNGTIDLRTGALLPHRQEDLITRVCGVEYDRHAACPTWERCLHQWQGGNEDMIGYLQRAAGYSLTGNVSEQCLFFLHGDGANGKSTFLDVLLTMLGEYGMQAVSEMLVQRKSEVHLTERADLHNRRMVATIETDDGRKMAEALVKQVTGGDRIRARKCHKDCFEFLPTFKIWLAANHKPAVKGTDHAIWRRIKVVPFTVTIPPESRDPNLSEKLRAELPGILAWAVRGCMDWQLRNSLGEPEEVTAATDNYRTEQDLLGAFIRDVCQVHPEYRTRAGELLDAYKTFTGDKEMTPREFAKQLKARNYISKQGTGGYMYWHGLGLPSESGCEVDHS